VDSHLAPYTAPGTKFYKSNGEDFGDVTVMSVMS